MTYIGVLLAITFAFSVAGLFVFVWTLSAKSSAEQRHDAEIIFQDVGKVEEPAGTTSQEAALQAQMTHSGPRASPMSAAELAALDRSSRGPFLIFIYGAMGWLSSARSRD